VGGRTSDYLRESEMKARDPRNEYVMKGQEIMKVTVKLNPSHMDLPLCSGVLWRARCGSLPRQQGRVPK
jgi:hypothetical protein